MITMPVRKTIKYQLIFMLKYWDKSKNRWLGLDLMEIRSIISHKLGFMIIIKKDDTEVVTDFIKSC